MTAATAPTRSLPAARTVDPRDERAQEIARDAGQWARCRLRDGRKAYGVPAQSRPNVYYLTDGRTCTCPDFQQRQQPCKHARAVKLHVARVKAADETARLAAQYDAIFGGDA